MNKGTIEKVLSAKTKQIVMLSTAISPQFAAEDIHQFRVAVKRLRAFFRLLKTDKENPSLKLPKQFKKLYDIAGAIREAQLEDNRIIKDHLPIYSYRQQLHSNIDDQITQWHTHYSKSVVKKLEQKITGHSFHKLDTEILQVFFKERLLELDKIFTVYPDNEQIHTYRKRIKDLLYIIKLTEKEWDKGYEMLIEFPSTALDHLSDTLGSYNDERIMLDNILRFASPTTTPEENEQQYQLCQKEIALLEEKKKIVVTEIKKFLKLAHTQWPGTTV